MGCNYLKQCPITNTKCFVLNIHVTNYCNFNCEYCSFGIPYKKDVSENFSIEKLKIAIMYVNKYLANFEIHPRIRGGEPLLHPQFDKIIGELKQIKNNNQWVLFTNGSVELSKYSVDYSIFNELRISIHTDIVQHNKKYTNIIFDNINYLLNQNILPKIHIMKSKISIAENINFIFNTVSKIFNEHKINLIRENIKIVDAFPSYKYENKNYDYTKIKSRFNMNYTLPVYYCRAIKIMPDMSYKYSCELARESLSPIGKIYFPYTWEDILKKTENTIVCKLPTCTSPSYCTFDLATM